MGYRAKMSREDRAKQFMPFAALKGYPEALRLKEKIIVPKREVSEEYGEELDRELHEIHRGDMVTVTYFCRGEYLKISGLISRIDLTARVLKVVNTKIPMADIYEINTELGQKQASAS